MVTKKYRIFYEYFLITAVIALTNFQALSPIHRLMNLRNRRRHRPEGRTRQTGHLSLRQVDEVQEFLTFSFSKEGLPPLRLQVPLSRDQGGEALPSLSYESGSSPSSRKYFAPSIMARADIPIGNTRKRAPPILPGKQVGTQEDTLYFRFEN